MTDFWASWCAPCKQIAPKFQQLATQYRQTQFAKVDVDACQSLAASCGITAMPTFQFYKAGKKIGEIKGADPASLERMVKQHSEVVEKDEKLAELGGHADLKEHIQVAQVDALNQSTAHPVKNIFTNNTNVQYLESDTDEQLLISIPFMQNVKLHSIKIVATDPAKAPKVVKTYINRLALGFDEAESIEPTETLEFEAEDLTKDAKPKQLRFVRYQSVGQVILFVESNQNDEETTRIDQIIFYGTPVETTKMSDLKKQEHDH